MISEERIQKFWEWCGFEDMAGKPFRGFIVDQGWYSPSGSICNALPPIEPTPLFKYAVPKLDYWLISAEGSKGVGAVAQYKGKTSTCFDKDPATALFLAIEEIKGE